MHRFPNTQKARFRHTQDELGSYIYEVKMQPINTARIAFSEVRVQKEKQTQRTSQHSSFMDAIGLNLHLHLRKSWLFPQLPMRLDVPGLFYLPINMHMGERVLKSVAEILKKNTMPLILDEFHKYRFGRHNSPRLSTPPPSILKTTSRKCMTAILILKPLAFAQSINKNTISRNHQTSSMQFSSLILYLKERLPWVFTVTTAHSLSFCCHALRCVLMSHIVKHCIFRY